MVFLLQGKLELVSGHAGHAKVGKDHVGLFALIDLDGFFA